MNCIAGSISRLLPLSPAPDCHWLCATGCAGLRQAASWTVVGHRRLCTHDVDKVFWTIPCSAHEYSVTWMPTLLVCSLRLNTLSVGSCDDLNTDSMSGGCPKHTKRHTLVGDFPTLAALYEDRRVKVIGKDRTSPSSHLLLVQPATLRGTSPNQTKEEALEFGNAGLLRNVSLLPARHWLWSSCHLLIRKGIGYPGVCLVADEHQDQTSENEGTEDVAASRFRPRPPAPLRMRDDGG